MHQSCRFAIFKNVSRPIGSGFWGKNFGDGKFHAIAYSWSEAQNIVANLQKGNSTELLNQAFKHVYNTIDSTGVLAF